MHAPPPRTRPGTKIAPPCLPAHRDLLLLAFFFFFFLLWASCASSMLEAVDNELLEGCSCKVQWAGTNDDESAEIRFAGINTV